MIWNSAVYMEEMPNLCPFADMGIRANRIRMYAMEKSGVAAELLEFLVLVHWRHCPLDR